MWFLALVGCAPDTFPDGPGGTVAEATGGIAGTAVVAPNADNPFSAFVTLTVDQDARVHVAYGEGSLDHQTPAVDARAGEPVTLLVLGLRAGRTYDLAAVATAGALGWTSAPLSFDTEPLPATFQPCTPTFHVDPGEFDPDEVVCSNALLSSGGHLYLCTDRWGEPVYSARTADDDSLFTMTPMPDGGWVSTSYNASKLLFFDAAGRPTAEYPPSFFAGRTRFHHDFVDVHEALPLTEGVWAGAVLFLTGIYEYFEDGSYKLGNGLIVFDPAREEVLYDYSLHGDLGDGVAMDPMLPYGRTGLGDFEEDWTHVNSVLHEVEPDGREALLLSSKSQDWVVKLHPDTDSLAWAFGWGGGFRLVDDLDAAEPVDLSDREWPYHQHGLSWTGWAGTRRRLLLFDNGYPRRVDGQRDYDLVYSRVVEYAYDDATGLAEEVFRYGSEDPTSPDWFHSYTRGNAILLPDEDAVVFLVGESLQMREVSYPAGERRWDLQCEGNWEGMYRVTWFPDIYTRTWRDGG